MLDSHFKKEEFKKAVKENVKMLYRKTIDEATQQQIFQAVSLAVKDVIIDASATDGLEWGIGWMWDDETNPYLPKYSPTTINENKITVTDRKSVV